MQALVEQQQQHLQQHQPPQLDLAAPSYGTRSVNAEQELFLMYANFTEPATTVILKKIKGG
jgi:hypothetical protein